MPSHAVYDPRSTRTGSGRPGQFEGNDTQQALITGKHQYARGEFNARVKAAMHRPSGSINKLKLVNQDQLSFGRGDFMFCASDIRVIDIGDRRGQRLGSLPFGEGNGTTTFADFSGILRKERLNAPSNELVALMRWQKNGISLNEIDYKNMERNPKHGCTVMHAGTMTVFHSGFERMPLGVPFAVIPPPEDEIDLQKFLDQSHHPKSDPDGAVRGMVVPVTFDRVMSVMEKSARIITDSKFPLTWKDTFSKLNETSRNASSDKSFQHQIHFIAAARAQQVVFQHWVSYVNLTSGITSAAASAAAMAMGLVPPSAAFKPLDKTNADLNDSARRVLQIMFSDCMGAQPGIDHLDMSALVESEHQKTIRSTQLRAMVMSERAIMETARALTCHVRGETMTAAIPGEKFDAITYS